jgi:hypothetical protein
MLENEQRLLPSKKKVKAYYEQLGILKNVLCSIQVPSERLSTTNISQYRKV